MIILKHLTVERFRLLRELNIHFPQRGSVLIHGPNESGKSALLESIYFALYGEPLTLNRERHPLDELILYGTSSALVTLAFSVGATELVVTRTIHRSAGQTVSLLVRRLGLPEEGPITHLETANTRIITELGRVTGDTLRNSCLIEQKGLARLEQLSGVERETTTRKLLGLEKLLSLTRHFKVAPGDEKALEESREYLRLAEMQARIPELSQRLKEIDMALDAVKVLEDLQEISDQESEIAEQQQSFEQIRTRRSELKIRQGRIQQLKKADATLGEIIDAYDLIAEARRQIPELERQIAELERREQEELPALDKRVNDLADLTRSFGTLQRMSNDLLTAVDSIKELEQELKQHDEVQDDLKSLEEQIAHARSRLEQAQQALNDLEERRRAGRPQLEGRLEQMQALSERLGVLHELEEQYTRRLSSKEQIEQHKDELSRVQKDLRETEHELELVEEEARQAQQEADALETRWRQLNICRQLEEWQRLKGMAEGLQQAEQHVRLAYQQQEKLNLVAMETHSAATRFQIILITCIALFLVCLAGAAFEMFALHTPLFATVLGLAAILLAAGAGLSFQNYNKVSEEVKETDKQVQEATSKVRMMIAAREAAMHMGGDSESLQQIEREIRSLGGKVPRSLEEAQAMIRQVKDQGERPADVQQRMREKLEEANAARNQVNVTMEAVAALRKKRAHLEELRQRESWETIDENISNDRAALERMHQEITLLAGQQGLPLPSINERLQSSSFASSPSFSQDDEELAGVPELETLVESTIKATEHELAALDGKLDLVSDRAAQVKIHQEALDVLLARKKVIEARNERYKTNNPALQVERAREQQAGLRQALQSLQDSLRQRVKPLGIAFGQTAISNAEAAARKQLEELHITLGNKIMLQEQLSDYTAQLKELQEELAEHYKQLAKYSNSLGSWIVPPKPFADVLQALRTRCTQELAAEDEQGSIQELETLRNREGAVQSKIALCRQEIANTQERIAALLAQYHRPAAREYTREAIATTWPMLNTYTVEDRSHLEEDRGKLEQELTDLEEQELALSTRLQPGTTPLDLQQARARVEQLERSYETRKRGGQLLQTVDERLLKKMLPRTEYYMRQILRALTAGRYHDVHLSTQPEEGTISGGPLHISVWEAAAGEYVSRSALSGGTADQLSLALRLAFAIAVLPRELGAAPGFICLDEPLSSFDPGRARALVDVVTGTILSQHFEQVLLISHSGAFDPTMFPYHIYLENGAVVESNLPVVAAPPSASANDLEEGATQLRIVAIPARVGVE